MNRADRMQEEGDKRRGIIVGFALAGLQRRLASSPEAIYHSLRRRRERLAKQAERAAASGRWRQRRSRSWTCPRASSSPTSRTSTSTTSTTTSSKQLEDQVIDAATAAATAEELDVEILELAELVDLAEGVRTSGIDTKWTQLRDLLRSEEFRSGGGPRKLIVFSEHKDTLTYVAERIAAELGRARSGGHDPRRDQAP